MICELEEKLQNMSAAADLSVCANCGKEGSGVNNICNKCKQVKYCNAACKKKHRNKHKKECEEHVRLAAESAAKLHDEKLFKQPPPKEDCPICFILLPTLNSGSKYYVCCGKTICSGCCHAPVYDDRGNVAGVKKCSFCRTLLPTTDTEMIKRYKKRMNAGDPIAVYNLGNYYRDGLYGLSQDHTKAFELWHRAAELGHAMAYSNIGYAYSNGQGVEVDQKKAIQYYELAAMGGNEVARHNLGNSETRAGNSDRALRHYMIATRSGHSISLNNIKQMYTYGFVTKEDYTKALQSYQEYLGEIKSAQRDKAATARETYRYH